MGVAPQRRRRRLDSLASAGRVLLAALDSDGRGSGEDGIFGVLSSADESRHRLLLDALDAGPALPAAAERHGVSGFVRLLLVSSGAVAIEGLAPTLAAVDHARLAGLHVHLRALADLGTIAATFDTALIPWTVLKGPALAETVYSRPDLRTYGDLDLLVAPEAFGDALEALEALGGQVLDLNWRLAAEMVRGEISVALPSGTQIDLHWHPINELSVRRRLGLRTEDLLGRAQVVGLRGVPARVLDPLDSVVYVAVHGCLSGGYRLVWLEDVHRSVVTFSPSWEELLADARDGGVGFPVGLMLDRVRRLRRTPVPTDIVEALVGGAPGRLLAAPGNTLATPSRLVRGRHTGRSICEAAGPTPGATARTLVGAWETRLARDNRRGRRPPPTLRDLRAPSGSPRDRGLFLDRVARHRGR